MERTLKAEQWRDTSTPTQEFFSIGRGVRADGPQAHVLRYWESQFRFLNPAKNRSGNRVYKSAKSSSSCW